MTRIALSIAIGLFALGLLLVVLAAIFPAVGQFYQDLGTQLNHWGQQLRQQFGGGSPVTVKKR